MNCPVCSESMRTDQIGKVEIDVCTKCDGVWFDQDELRKAKDETDSDLNWMDFEIWKHEDKFTFTPRELKCPKCLKGMVAISYDKTGVEIDYCPDCKGAWLDEGEFGKIIESLNFELANKSLSDYFSASIEEAKEIIAGPESFISEWKDFVTILRMFQYRFFIEKPEMLDSVIKAQQISPFK